MIECGGLDLNEQVDKAILIVGRTKAGKTTSAHNMTGQVLRGALNLQNNLSYQLVSTKS